MIEFWTKVRKQPERLARTILWLYFRFDKWHINTLAGRKYAGDIIRYLQSQQGIQNLSVAEIGCGLGDLIRRLNCRERWGFDFDRNALRAARFLAKISKQRNIHFEYFEFPDSQFRHMVDVIIMVNWIHHVEPAVLKSKLHEYFDNHLCPNGQIVVDTVQGTSYKFNHDIHFLTDGMICTVQRIGDDVNGREIFAIRK